MVVLVNSWYAEVPQYIAILFQILFLFYSLYVRQNHVILSSILYRSQPVLSFKEEIYKAFSNRWDDTRHPVFLKEQRLSLRPFNAAVIFYSVHIYFTDCHVFIRNNRTTKIKNTSIPVNPRQPDLFFFLKRRVRNEDPYLYVSLFILFVQVIRLADRRASLTTTRILQHDGRADKKVTWCR